MPVKMKRYLPLAIIAGVFLIALGTGTLLFFHFRPPPAFPVVAAAILPGAQPPQARGSVNAPVTLEEFGDFECPPCGNLSPYLDEFEKIYRGKLRLVFREFPMSVHPHAYRVACAAEAAGLQNKFWEMHDLLYRERLIWPRADDLDKKLTDYAARLQLDVDLFRRDIDGPVVNARIAADQARAAALGVTRTPALFVDGQLIPPRELSPIGIREAIEAALKRK